MHKHVITATVVALALLVGSTANAADQLSTARAGTARFHNIDAAFAAGYGLFTDAAGIACIDNAAGGMGIHYVRGALVGDGAVNAATPEALVYEPTKNGRLRLVAVEYVVFQADWNRTNAPSLFGETFTAVSSPNRYGLPPFYELHAWIWNHNANGMFEDWNPGVSCGNA